MSDWSRVRVRIDEDGKLAAVEVDGDIDKTQLTEERPEAPPLPADPTAGQVFWPLA